MCVLKSRNTQWNPKTIELSIKTTVLPAVPGEKKTFTVKQQWESSQRCEGVLDLKTRPCNFTSK